MIFDVGRVCVKLAGRDAGKKCVVLGSNDASAVLIDGETRRKYCNPLHLEPTTQQLDVVENADHDAVVAAFKSVDVEIPSSSSSDKKKAGLRPKKQKAVKKSS